MARDRHGKRIRPASLGDSSRRLAQTYHLRHFGITHCLPDWNSLKRFPDTLLKGGAANIERQIQSDSWSLYKGNHLRDELLVLCVPANQVGLGKLILKVPDKDIWIIT